MCKICKINIDKGFLKLPITSEKFVSENINYKDGVIIKYMQKEKNEILIWREH